ncbi:indole-3-acetic acid-amido synthetase GH3.10 isoform X1 [Selaginella moellendorffii]|uniref:indole-3-acetic acid-amido synthetase GH3.10 isoform X1 n=1 Tax=Selaginella moellendorffii TaxID=88036 RepID=UPI000D1C2860|nr:indole-3-acetic acid-amido synthetase GH3.10 isoform X1 [Selaginella moellendorffii]|eukprot:XP_024516808.1 indole-3-acetic acid-amido synthetase GH3.10 isoform X1 [Selaginella moellendorffii]
MEALVNEFEDMCRNAALVQEEILGAIVEHNASCEYLRSYNVTDTDSFKAHIPIVDYEDIAARIQRMADGGPGSVLCKDPVIVFILSSATTTDKRKAFPLTTKSRSLKNHADKISAGYRERDFPVGSFPTALAFMYAQPHGTLSKSGLPIMPGSSFYFTSQVYKERPSRSTSTDEVIFGPWWESTYCHLLSGLILRTEVDYITSFFAYTLVHAFNMLEAEWRNLCYDIRTGKLDERVKDVKLRAAVVGVLREDPDSAGSIEEVCSSNVSWDQGIVLKLWPKAKYLLTVVTGGMKPYIPALRRYAGGVHIMGRAYIGSEGVYGINIDPATEPENVVFTLVPTTLYMEFLRLRDNKLVDSSNLEISEQYELVITTHSGLYRYKVGDVVKVVAFFHESPQMAFEYRRSAVLSVSLDMTSEQELQNVVRRTCIEANLEIVDFTSHSNLSEQPGHYVIYWELKNEPNIYSNHALLNRCCNVLDRSFTSILYITGRRTGTIGPLKLVTVKKGCFGRLLEHAVRNGSAAGQYKTPRCIKSPKVLEILEGEIVTTYRSSEYLPKDHI